jgi:hypothetical protein
LIHVQSNPIYDRLIAEVAVRRVEDARPDGSPRWRRDELAALALVALLFAVVVVFVVVAS